MFDKKLIVSEHEQGTHEWHLDRMGIQSASKGELYLVKGKDDHQIGAGLMSYALELADKMAVLEPEFDSFSTKATQHGIDTEPYARDEYTKRNMCAVIEYGFINSSEVRMGFSPDGIIKGIKEGLEIKCYDTKNHIPIVLDLVVPKNVMAQCQFSLMVSGYDRWNAVFYDPRVVEHLQYRHFVIERDEAMIELMRGKAEYCSKIIDERLMALGINE